MRILPSGVNQLLTKLLLYIKDAKQLREIKSLIRHMLTSETVNCFLKFFASASNNCQLERSAFVWLDCEINAEPFVEFFLGFFFF